MGNPDRGRLIQALLNQYREACVIFATRQPGDPLGGEKADAELKARAAILAALTEAREGALREAAPVWTTTACPHCGGEVDGIRVLKESTLAPRPSPAAEPAPDRPRCRCAHGFPVGHLQHVSDATDVVHEATGCYALDGARTPVRAPEPAPESEPCPHCGGTVGVVNGGEGYWYPRRDCQSCGLDTTKSAPRSETTEDR